MWRAIFFALGLFVVMSGSTLLMVDRMVLAVKDDPKPVERPQEFRGMFLSVDENKNHVFHPPQWLAFTLMSLGSVTMLYAVALPKKHHHN